MSGPNHVSSGPQRFENMDCPVEVGEECVMPNRRGWGFDRTVNIPSIISIIMVLLSGIGYIVANDRRQTETEGEVKLLKASDKGIIDHASAVNEIAVRDRAEMRDDIKEIKQMLIKEGRH